MTLMGEILVLICFHRDACGGCCCSLDDAGTCCLMPALAGAVLPSRNFCPAGVRQVIGSGVVTVALAKNKFSNDLFYQGLLPAW